MAEQTSERGVQEELIGESEVVSAGRQKTDILDCVNDAGGECH